MINIKEYLEHKSKLSNPSPNRFIKEAKDFLLEYAKNNSINTKDLKILFYMLQHNLDNIPQCTYKDCQEKVRFLSFHQGFSKGCCHNHAKRISNIELFGVETPFESKQIQDKVKTTCLTRYGNASYMSTDNFKETMIRLYGVEVAMKSPMIKSKVIQTNINRYGGMGNASEIIHNKYKETMLKTYGLETIFETEQFKYNMHKIQNQESYKIQSNEVRKTTNLNKFGYENPFQSPEIKEKIIATNMVKFGTEHPMQSDKIQYSAKQTNINNHGVDNPMLLGTIKDKVKETNIKKYGVHNISLKDINNYHHYDDVSYISENFIENNHFNVYKFCEYFGVTLSTAYSKVKSLGVEYDYNRNTSILENDLGNFIESNLKIPIERNNRKQVGMELDIYIPSHNIAIEFNGVYWHSELNGKDKNYHLNKTVRCDENNIHLIHVYENEWTQKQEIVKSIISSKLNIFEKRIYARNTDIREVNNFDKNQFLVDNHLQGSDNSKISLGLYYRDELVCLMTFGISRYNKLYEYELHRFCSKLNFQVYGGASKLWKYFIKQYNPLSVISYSDRRYNIGQIYNKLGFKLNNISNPNYFYFKQTITLLSRLQFQKHKLSDKLIDYDSELTEWENMKNHGYNRIWDCGNYVFVWNK